MVASKFIHNNTDDSVRDEIADYLPGYHFPIHRLLCYRTLRHHEVAEVIKIYSSRGEKDLLQDLIDDIFGDVHERFHGNTVSNNSLSVNLSVKDHWDTYRLDNSLYNLFSYSEINSIEFLDSSLNYLISNPINRHIGFDAHKSFLGQPKVSKDMIEAISRWAVPSSQDYAETYNVIIDGVYGFLLELFSHPLFPSGKLIEYCGYPDSKFRETVLLAPTCPPEGRVTAALMSGVLTGSV